jgi:hypothetical protein
MKLIIEQFLDSGEAYHVMHNSHVRTWLNYGDLQKLFTRLLALSGASRNYLSARNATVSIYA